MRSDLFFFASFYFNLQRKVRFEPEIPTLAKFVACFSQHVLVCFVAQRYNTQDAVEVARSNPSNDKEAIHHSLGSLLALHSSLVTGA